MPASTGKVRVGEGECPPRVRDCPARAENRMPTGKYIRFEHGEKEYYDLTKDPYEAESNPGSVAAETRAYWEGRMDDLRSCSGPTCQAAEDRPASPDPAAP